MLAAPSPQPLFSICALLPPVPCCLCRSRRHPAAGTGRHSWLSARALRRPHIALAAPTAPTPPSPCSTGLRGDERLLLPDLAALHSLPGTLALKLCASLEQAVGTCDIQLEG